jgi:hypothetical protein
MAGAGFHSIAKLRALTPWFATIRITAWQSALICTADCQTPLSGLIRTLRAFQAFGIPLSNSDSWLWQSAVQQFSLWQSAWKTPRSANIGLKIWARSLAIEWNPAPAILHRETACLKRHIFLTRDFTSVKLIRGAFFRHKLNTNGLSLYTISWYYRYTFKAGYHLMSDTGYTVPIRPDAGFQKDIIIRCICLENVAFRRVSSAAQAHSHVIYQ